MLIDADDCRVVQLYSGGRVYITFRGNAFALDRRDREFIALIADTLSKYEEKSEEALESALDEAMGETASNPPAPLVEPQKPKTITAAVKLERPPRSTKLTNEMARLMRERYSEGGISMAELGADRQTFCTSRP